MRLAAVLLTAATAVVAAAPRAASDGGRTAPGCRVTVSSLTLAAWTPARQAALEPSPTKVPTVIRGLVDMYVYATDGEIQPDFTLEADLPEGTILDDWVINMDAVPGGGAQRAATFVGALAQPPLVPEAKPAHVAFQVNATSQAFAPASVRVNGVPCALESKADLAAPVPPLLAPAEPHAAAGLRRSTAAERPVSVNGSQLIGVDGAPFTVMGANWFGFETGQTIVDGLWGNTYNALVSDFATVAWRFKLIGFNTIRLPFSFQAFAQTPRDPTYRTCGTVTEAAMRASVTPPGVSVPASTPLWWMPSPIAQTPGVCNDYVPRDSVKQRLLWAAKFLAANGFYVVLDDHLALDTLAVDDPTAWVAAWKSLAADVVSDPVMRNRVMFDILNEPDARSIKWQSGPGRGGYGMTALYEMAMDAIYSVAPTSLMLIEGTGQQNTIAMNWGDGFATDPAAVAAAGVDPALLDSAAPFFIKLLSKPYAGNVIVSPHVYPPSVSLRRDPAVVTGAGLARRLTTSFGYLTKKGFCDSGGACRIFPVVFGETGSRFSDALDVKMLNDFATYMQTDDGTHAAIPNMIWWCWNANSGDTGGIVADNWLDILSNKVEWLTKAANLKPWYKAAIEAGSSPTPPPGPPSPPPPPPPPPSCTDIPPDSIHTCAQQVGWGKCGLWWMEASGKCLKSCGACGSSPSPTPTPLPTPAPTPPITAPPPPAPPPPPPPPPPSSCTDIPPDSTYTCAQQVGWGKCGLWWMEASGKCLKSCGACGAPSPCSDIPPDSIHTCAQQVGWGKCGLWWMEASGKCLKSCGACGSPPTATTTPGLALTLAPTLAPTSAPASLPALPPEVHGDVEGAAVVGTIEGDLGPTTPSPPSTFACTAQINTHTWQSSSTTWSASVNVTLTANSTRSVPYYASLYNLAYIETTAAWNWYPAETPTSGWITGIVTESWQALGDGASAQVALIVSGRSPDLQPSAFTVADTLCMIQTAA